MDKDTLIGRRIRINGGSDTIYFMATIREVLDVCERWVGEGCVGLEYLVTVDDPSTEEFLDCGPWWITEDNIVGEDS